MPGKTQKVTRGFIEKEMEKRRKEHVHAATKVVREKEKKLNTALAAINEKFGEATLVPIAGSRAEHVSAIPSGFERLDDLLTGHTDDRNRTIDGSGVGIPRGRIIEIYGPEASGKTTLTLHFIKAAQQAGYTCAFVDAEHALDASYAAKIGVDLKTLLLNQPDNAEQAFDIMKELAASGAVDMIVCDSVSALEPEVEDEEDMSKSQVALQARLMSKGLRKLVAHVGKNDVVMVFVNQVRKKIGVRFGNPETTSGGNALRFYASVRLDVRKVKTLTKGDVKFAIRSRIRSIKNKVAPPFRDIHVDIHHNKGIVDTYGDFVPGGKGGASAETEDD